MAGPATSPYAKPHAVKFKPTVLNDTSWKTVKIVNPTDADVYISTITPSGGPFQHGGWLCPAGQPFTVPAGGSCSLDASFTPTSEGVATGSYTVTFGYSVGSILIPASGRGRL